MFIYDVSGLESGRPRRKAASKFNVLVMLVSPRKSTITIATVKGRTIKRTYLRLILKEIERGAGM